MGRALATAMLLVLATHAMASDEARMVCAYTGRVLTLPCPCPPEGGEAPAPARLQRASCCEVLDGSELPPGQRPGSPLASIRVDGGVLALPVAVRAWRTVSTPVLPSVLRSQAPPGPRARLFVRHRQLLI